MNEDNYYLTYNLSSPNRLGNRLLTRPKFEIPEYQKFHSDGLEKIYEYRHSSMLEHRIDYENQINFRLDSLLFNLLGNYNVILDELV